MYVHGSSAAGRSSNSLQRGADASRLMNPANVAARLADHMMGHAFRSGIPNATAPVTSASDVALTEQDLQDNHNWLRGLESITVGFDFNAPGSGHVGASFSVLQKILSIVAESNTQIRVAALEGDEWRLQPIIDRLPAEQKERVSIHLPQIDRDDSRAALMIFGALDNSTVSSVTGKYRAFSGHILTIQPPYFGGMNREPSLVTYNSAPETLTKVSNRHIFTMNHLDQEPNHEPSSAFQPLFNRIDEYLHQGFHFVIFYGETLNPAVRTKVSDGLNALESQTVCLSISGKEGVEGEVRTAPSQYPEKIVFLEVDRLPQADFNALISRCTLPSVLGGANSANDFQVKGKPWFMGSAKYFDAAFAENRPYDPVTGIPELKTAYQRYVNGEFKEFFTKLNGYVNPNRDRFEVAVHEARQKL